jgi:hypothetical protein
MLLLERQHTILHRDLDHILGQAGNGGLDHIGTITITDANAEVPIREAPSTGSFVGRSVRNLSSLLHRQKRCRDFWSSLSGE